VRTLSIAMATCDGERFLAEQLTSIAQQTAPPLELVVSDDASGDATPSIVEGFARDAPFPVSLHRNETRLGVGENFVRAAGLCRGDLVAFADQDDVWRPEKLERCAAALEQHRALLVVHACEVVDEALRPLGRSVPAIPAERVAEPLATPRWAEAPGMAMVFERDLLSLLPWEARPAAHHRHGRLLHDEWVLALARLGGRTAFLPDRLVLYRQHEVNVEGTPEPARPPLAIGSEYYRLRSVQARGWAELLREGPFAGEGGAWGRLADALELRAPVHDSGRRRVARASLLGRAARSGAYRPRSREGFGVRGLLRDAALIVAGR
jgi:glycosyltransferase involved in cell wall biosynthesis